MDDPQAHPSYRSITVVELAGLLAARPTPRFIDIREPHEWRLGGFEGAEPLPLSDLRHWWPTLDPSAPLIVCCQRGNRSRALCQALAAAGFTALWDLAGGVEALGGSEA